jgi:hypothetical protein
VDVGEAALGDRDVEQPPLGVVLDQVLVQAATSRVKSHLLAILSYTHGLDLYICMYFWTSVSESHSTKLFCPAVEDYDAAVSAALTYLQFIPDSDDMLKNLDYYRSGLPNNLDFHIPFRHTEQPRLL